MLWAEAVVHVGDEGNLQSSGNSFYTGAPDAAECQRSLFDVRPNAQLQRERNMYQLQSHAKQPKGKTTDPKQLRL